ncbi:MAG: glycosyltransferase [Actinobacteria bacterium]|nr:glycosyltransferase [Actinomycetota bacterium]
MKPERHVLLISPVFHGYWEGVVRGLRSNGYRVTTWRYDERPTLAAKLRGKVLYDGMDRITDGGGTARQEREVSDAGIRVLGDAEPDIVIVIKGDQFDDRFWDALADLGVPSLVWLYDEIRRMRWSVDRLAQHRIVSYSPLDVAAMRASGIDATLVHDAFDPGCVGPTVPSDDVLFIGARYPHRTETLLELHRRGLPIRVVGRDWSRRWTDRLRTLSWERPDLPSGPPVPRSVAVGMMAGAFVSLNLHENQDGFTMRTFESAGVGGVQVIDRADVESLYEPGREILVATNVDEMVDVVGRIAREPAWAARIAAAGKVRTLAEHTFAHRIRTLEPLWA